MLIVLCAALFLDSLDVSMVGVALPSIRADLHLSTGSLQWIVSAYVLGYAGFLLLGGRAADLLGRRRVFIVALAVFLVASTLGGVVNDGTLLIATRFIKGVSAAFTAPAGLAIITTTFPEGAARNKALAVYTATAATGFSLGLVFGGVLTEIGWRWVFFLPAPVALAALVGAIRYVPGEDIRRIGGLRAIDLAGAVLLTSAMLLLVFTLVESPTVGWSSARTLGSFAAVAAIFAAFVVRERRASAPLIRLGILRSSALVRANIGAMMLFGGWVGFQFIATLYLQQLQGWSALETGAAIFPAGLLVVLLSPGVAQLIGRIGATKPIAAGLLATAAGYALFVPNGVHSTYLPSVLPTMVLVGIGFALAYGPLNVAATQGVATAEQGLAGGLLNTSFQFGGALVLAVVAAVDRANTDSATPQGLLNGFHPALVVSVAAAVLGAVIVGVRSLDRAPQGSELESAHLVSEAEAA